MEFWVPFNRFWVVLLFTLHVKRGLVFLLSFIWVFLHILRQIFALVSCYAPLVHEAHTPVVELVALREMVNIPFLEL